MEGIEAFARFLSESMAGLDDWTFPVEFTAVVDDNVIVKWTEEIPKARRHQGQPVGLVRLIYAGDGKFSYEEDVLNMAHVLEDIASSGWQPTGAHSPPPKQPVRDWSIPG